MSPDATRALSRDAEVVLLAEQDDELREEAAEALRRDGFQVIEVEDGLELQDYLDALSESGFMSQPDVIISDAALPGYSGLEVLVHLRERDRVTPFILLASEESPVTEEAQIRGADLVLPKPVDIDQLRTAVSVTA